MELHTELYSNTNKLFFKNKTFILKMVARQETNHFRTRQERFHNFNKENHLQNY